MTYEPIISRLAIPPLFSDLNDEDAKKLVRDGILWEYHGWYCFTRKGFRQYIDSGTVEQDEIDESYQLTCHYCHHRGIVPLSFCSFAAWFISWLSWRRRRLWLFRWRVQYRLKCIWWGRLWFFRLECWYLRCLKYWYRLQNQFGSHPEDSISFSKKEKKCSTKPKNSN